MALDTEQAPPHEFPSWPMNYLTYYRHLADDYARCVGALGKATDPAQAARAEGDYGVRVMHDMMQAWYDLALAPFTAMAKAATAAPPQAVAKEPPATKAG
jgi:hypothetical protein